MTPLRIVYKRRNGLGGPMTAEMPNAIFAVGFWRFAVASRKGGHDD